MKQGIWIAAGALVAVLGGGVVLLHGAGPAPGSPARGMVVVSAPASAPAVASSAPRHGATLGALPEQVAGHVRQAYPLLRDVAFRCDPAGCSVTATIPPPTDEAFLARRQEMLLGGLARAAGEMGYQALGPVQMDEVSENLFHIRLAVTQARPGN